MPDADICIAGAGVIGLSLALELEARGLDVVIFEAGRPLGEASIAAAGMLAAQDPHNPPEIAALSRLSVSLYPEFLDRLAQLGGHRVPFQTSHTLQSLPSMPDDGLEAPSLLGFEALLLGEPGGERGGAPGAASPMPPGFCLLEEHSLDPRGLAVALLAAVRNTTVRLLSESPVVLTRAAANSVLVTASSSTVEAKHFIDCTGAWSKDPAFRVLPTVVPTVLPTVLPIKGQMLAVSLPPRFPMKLTVRTESVYIVPRTLGPHAGRAVLGATVEDAGFDKTVHASQIEALRRQAVALLPQLNHAPVVESWAGLRPATPDRLPLLGMHPTRPRHWIAAGHYRNGILLAPATARVMAQLLLGESPSTPLDHFAPARQALCTT